MQISIRGIKLPILYASPERLNWILKPFNFDKTRWIMVESKQGKYTCNNGQTLRGGFLISFEYILVVLR